MPGPEHLRRLAREPRPTGSPQAAEARQYCGEVLTSLGYRVAELPFEYSAAVGEYGTPVVGVIALAAVIATLGRRGGLALGGLALLLLAGRWLARRGVLDLPMRRRQGVNIEARRSETLPSLWLVAHIDSKSQPVPLLVRAAGIILLSIAWIAAVFAPSAAAIFVGVAAVLGAIPVMASVVGVRSPGAIDNASGVATVLMAASLLPAQASVGVLITDAEELGLAGARAWCARNSPGVVLNCDGVDDAGTLTLMWTRPRAPRLEEAMRRATDEPLRVIPLLPGVLVDALAFSNAGWDAVTVSRGTLGTLRRIHTRGDNLEHLKGVGIASTARALARAALTLTERR